MHIIRYLLLVTTSICQCFVTSLPTICSFIPSITFRDGFDVTKHQFPLIVFSPLQCSTCYGFLKRLNDIANRYQTKFVIVAPDFESNHIITRTSTAFPFLRIDRAREGWRNIGARNFDTLIIDECGRLINTIQSPSIDSDTHRIVTSAIDMMRSGKNRNCGKCIPTFNLVSHQRKINAYHEQERRETFRRQQQQQQQPPSSSHSNPYYPHPNHAMHRTSYQQQFGPTTPSTTLRTPISTTRTPAANSDDYEDYYQNFEEKSIMKTTQAPQTQIPRPPENNQNWPTPPTSPHYQNQYYQEGFRNGFSHQQRVTKSSSSSSSSSSLPSSIDSKTNLPCSAYTDDICYQQQERLAGNPLPDCCNKGVYLTDVCVPGKCSNSTTQLCCFQKFLQARFSCCNDPNQDEAKTPTNQFNKCCYSNFVDEDSCCGKEAATKYWSSVYEVCYPTTFVNYTSIKFEVRFTEGVRVIDLSVNKQWDFKCHFGSQRLQYAYIP